MELLRARGCGEDGIRCMMGEGVIVVAAFLRGAVEAGKGVYIWAL